MLTRYRVRACRTAEAMTGKTLALPHGMSDNDGDSLAGASDKRLDSDATALRLPICCADCDTRPAACR